MPNFKDLNSLFKHVEKQMHETLSDEVYDVVTETMSQNVQSEVYDAYNPYEYQRRGNSGGLADKNNMMASFYTISGGVEMLVQNITKGSNQNFYIAPLVEYGDDAGYGEYQYKKNRDDTEHLYLQSRPFMYETMRDLERTLRHVQAMKVGLHNRGIDTY